MEKLSRFILKVIYTFPFCFLYFAVIKSFSQTSLSSLIISSLVISVGYIFWNWFDYEKFNALEMNDFLECKHEAIIKNLAFDQNQIMTQIELLIPKFKILNQSNQSIEIEIENKIFNSILHIEKSKNHVKITIRRKFFNLLPDFAKNLKIIYQIEKSLEKNLVNQTNTSNDFCS